MTAIPHFQSPQLRFWGEINENKMCPFVLDFQHFQQLMSSQREMTLCVLILKVWSLQVHFWLGESFNCHFYMNRTNSDIYCSWSLKCGEFWLKSCNSFLDLSPKSVFHFLLPLVSVTHQNKLYLFLQCCFVSIETIRTIRDRFCCHQYFELYIAVRNGRNEYHICPKPLQLVFFCFVFLVPLFFFTSFNSCQWSVWAEGWRAPHYLAILLFPSCVC